MPNLGGTRSFCIRFDGEGTGAHVLPAPVLIESLAQIQRIVLLLAKMHRGEPLGHRTSFSRALQDEFALLCHLPETGSYAVPVEIGQQSESAAPTDLAEVCELFHQVASLVGGDDASAAQEIVTEPGYLALLTDAYRKAQPSPQTGVSLSIEDHQHRRILDGRRPLQALDGPSPTRPGDPIENSVSGLLVGMDFHKRNVLYRATPPLRFHVSYDAEDRLYDLNGDFNVALSANSRPELLRELHEVLTMPWTDYAQEKPARLSPKAQDMRTELQHRLQAA